MNRPRWPRLVQLLIVLALPVVLLVISMRLVTSHWFVRWEYGKPDFPPDLYGLSTAERTHLAEVCVDYLATSADISLLADLELPDGQPAFNDRELRHMADVQAVYDALTVAGVVAGVIVVAGMIALLVSPGARWRAPAALLRGSLLALGLLGIVGAFMALSWSQFFTGFHRVFFEGETWIFPYTDTLIRLFPMRFWIDVAVTIVAFFVAQALLSGAVGWVWMGRTQE